MSDPPDDFGGLTAPTSVPSQADGDPEPTSPVLGAELNAGLVRVLGEGGMGTVYLARDRQLDRPIAVKVLAQRLALNAGYRRAFIEEARTVARLQHPGIVPVHAISVSETGVCAFSMLAVEGEDLHRWMFNRRPRALHRRVWPPASRFCSRFATRSPTPTPRASCTVTSSRTT